MSPVSYGYDTSGRKAHCGGPVYIVKKKSSVVFIALPAHAYTKNYTCTHTVLQNCLRESMSCNGKNSIFNSRKRNGNTNSKHSTMKDVTVQ